MPPMGQGSKMQHLIQNHVGFTAVEGCSGLWGLVTLHCTCPNEIALAAQDAATFFFFIILVFKNKALFC